MSINSVRKIRDKVPVKYAFISLSDKSESELLVEQLFDICPGLTVFSSGGTYTHLAKSLAHNRHVNNIVEVAEYTGLPETDGGLVKTLHHKLFLGYLTETFNASHQGDMQRENAVPIDLVIVDLYPFDKVRADPESTLEICRGHIDVGGPSALRAAAKNFLRVMTVPDYSSSAYDALIGQINANRGCTDISMRRQGFAKTFEVLAQYDGAIARFAKGLTYDDVEKMYEIV